jgi:thioredoxin 1
MSSEINFNESNFDSTIGSGVALVDFFAGWCAPCKMQAPIVDKLAEKYAGKASVGKLNVDESQSVAQKYGVRGIPTLIVFRNGREVERLVGVQDEARLSAAIEKALSLN